MSVIQNNTREESTPPGETEDAPASSRIKMVVRYLPLALTLVGGSFFSIMSFNLVKSVEGGQAYSLILLLGGLALTAAVAAGILQGISQTKYIERVVKEKTRELRESERSLNSAQAISSVGSWEWNIVDDALVLSDEMRRIFGFPDGWTETCVETCAENEAAAVLSRAVHPEEKARVERAVANARKNGTAEALTYRVVRPDGDVAWIYAPPPEVKRRGADGAPEILIGTVQDITGRMRAEEINKVLFDISNAVHTTFNLDELYKAVHESLNRILNTENFYIALHDKEKDSITFPYWAGGKEEPRPERPNFSETMSLTGMVINSGEPLIFNEEEILRISKASGREAPATLPKIWIGVPLKAGNEVTGAIVARSCSSTELYSESDIDILKSVAAQTALAIERKQNEEKLHRVNETLENILAASPIGIGVVKDRRFNWVNEEFVKMFGFDGPGECDGKSTRIIYPTREEYDRVGEEIYAAAGLAEIDTLLTRKDGSLFTGHIKVSAPDGFSPASWAVFTVSDIAWRKRAEKEQLELEARTQQVRKFESLNVMAGSIAHHFNNILTSILGRLELAAMDLPGESPALANIREAESAAERAADLSTLMLTYVGQSRLHMETIDMTRMIESNLSALQSTLSEKNSLKFIPSPRPALFRGDRTQILHALKNILSNADEAMDEMDGLVVLTAGVEFCEKNHFQRQPFTEDDLPAGEYAWFEVSDNGRGMDKETLAKVMDPFFTTKFAGRGIGMAVVLGIVRSHRGAVSIQAEPGKGAVVKLLFPGESE
ncbi:MAG: GAF domain-containing protein [Desulfobacterales bacterium]|nr:GAF domain-containing protein [Desulfobacterales bacterium]